MILIAGPCVIEGYDTLNEIATHLHDITKNKEIDFYFKSSCIKDNRTLHESYRGVGFEEGIKYLREIKRTLGIKITTDFHSIEQIKKYGNEVDLIQIPAFLAKQTSLLEAAVDTKNKIHIKKPQFVGPEDAKLIISNIINMGYSNNLIVTDRGTMLGYDKVFMDPRHIPIMRYRNNKVLVDITHPNKNYPNASNMAYTLAMSAVASGADGLFIETHPNCSRSKCDSATMYPLDKVRELINKAYSLYKEIK